MLNLSKGKRIEGSIKESAEDFVVNEITPNGVVLLQNRSYSPEELGYKGSEGNTSVFIMEKRNWNTIQALKELTHKFGRGFGSAGFAGTKDRVALTTQMCSMYGVDPERLLEAHVKDVRVISAWRSGRQIKLGDLLGNRFMIKVSTKDPNALERVSDIDSGLSGSFPNYYGRQRFGNRDTNVQIGISILKGELEEAVMLFLTSTKNEELESSIEARERLSKEMNFSKALEYFPKYLKYERTMLDSLSRNPTDFARALRLLPRQLLLMFVHSVESQIFNLALESRIKGGNIEPDPNAKFCPPNFYGFPDVSKVEKFSNGASKQFELGNIIGYNSKPEDLSAIETKTMESFGLSVDDFKVKRIPEANCKGAYRSILAPYLGFSSAGTDGGILLWFSLPAGSYATTLLSEFMRPSKTEYSPG